MKRGGPTHPKFARLGAALGIPAAYAVGIMETLYEYVGNYAPRGDVGRLQDDEIARGAGYPGDPAKLVEAMLREGLLERSKRHRLVIHDWSEHANGWVHAVLARNRLIFVDGTLPKTGDLKGDERPAANAFYEQLRSKARPRTVRRASNGALPSQAKPSPTIPNQAEPTRPGAQRPPAPFAVEGAPPPGPAGSAGSARGDSARPARLGSPDRDGMPETARRIGDLGFNSDVAERLAANGITVQRARVVLGECQRDPKARDAHRAAVGILARECGVTLLNGRGKTVGRSLDQASRELSKLRATRANTG